MRVPCCLGVVEVCGAAEAEVYGYEAEPLVEEEVVGCVGGSDFGDEGDCVFEDLGMLSLQVEGAKECECEARTVAVAQLDLSLVL